ncbi:IclR family transcriptional regulator [Kushneria sinocarnis]|uniref:IclR family transcriptional regulator n=1 Tax=Kushneria sinocarnis TaxID=595502 RepID=A0A420X1F8_9GAMM|nr:helix-turn-helix domain-containing protein [Kushneria sinocarnis]RKR07642.1 IclR family transcriptional regulator [Kushneria sinocarnis]
MPQPAHLPPEAERPDVAGTRTLARAMQLLRLVAAQGDRGATVGMLRQHSGLSRATLYRLLLSLRRQGLLRQPYPRGAYFLGYELLSLGARAGNASGLRELARPALLQLAAHFGDSFFLLVPDGYFALCLEMQDGDRPVRCFSQAVGGRILMGVGQASIALLAGMPAAQRQTILAHNAPRLTREYQLEMSRVRRQVSRAGQRGHAYSAGGIGLDGYTGVAVPVRTTQWHVVGALSCAIEIDEMTRGHRRALVAALKHHAGEVGERTGQLLRLT